MLRLVRIAARNVVRNRRRTFFTLSTIVLCVATTVVVRGIIGATTRSITENVTKGVTGDIQIYPPGYMDAVDAVPLDLTFAAGGEVEKSLADLDLAYSPRLRFAGMIFGKDDRTSFFSGIAIDPDLEAKVCPRLSEAQVVDGRYLKGRTNREVLLSRPFAEVLGVTTGDTVAILGRSVHGSISAKELKIIGLFEPAVPEAGMKVLYVPLEVGQSFVDLYDEYTEIAASAATLDASQDLITGLTTRFANGGEPVAEVYFWTDTMKFFQTVIGFQQAMAQVVTIIFFLIATAAIFNTMLMAVMERIKEVGISRALGMRKRQVRRLFLTEGALLGVFGAGIGVAIGGALVAVFGQVGLEFLPPGAAVPVVLHPSTTLLTIGLVSALAIVTSILAAFQPAAFASRMRPLDALRKT